MKLQWYVRPKGIMLNLLLNYRVANSLYPFIFLPKEIYHALQTNTPNLTYEALLVHEEVHRRRQANNFSLYFFKYLTSRGFREMEEKIAVIEAIRYLRTKGFKINLAVMKSIMQEDFLFLYPVSKWMPNDELEIFIRQILD